MVTPDGRAPLCGGAPAARPLFVVGCYRSGTTLLRLILDAHSRISIPRETRYLALIGPELSSYGELASDRAAQERLVRDIGRLLRRQNWPELPTWADVDAAVKRWTFPEVARAVNLHPCPEPERAGLAFWGDKTPEYVRSVFFLKRLFPDALFLNLVRDGRDVAASAMGLRFAGGRNPEALALEWNEDVLCGLLAERTVPGSVLTLRYEDLVGDAEATVRRVCDFLGLGFEPGMLAFHRRDAARDMAGEAHHRSVGETIHARSVGRYRRDLDPLAVARLERLMYNGLVGLGYRPDLPYQRPISATGRAWRLGANLVRLVGVRGLDLIRGRDMTLPSRRRTRTLEAAESS